MTKKTHQIDQWGGAFGKAYTDRNTFDRDELEALYQSIYGVTRTELNQRFLTGIDRSTRILEVGSNVGNQLVCLQGMGFTQLHGIELQPYAVELAKARTIGINILQGSAFDIPFKDRYFGLVFTSGVLIHLHPSDIADAMKEIHRCSNQYIWGFEYYADELTEVNYRGHAELLWKRDFARLYLSLFDDLELVREDRIRYLDGENVDSMFLLRKR